MRYMVQHGNGYDALVCFESVLPFGGELVKSVTYVGNDWLNNDMATIAVTLIDNDTVEAVAFLYGDEVVRTTATIEETLQNKHAAIKKISGTGEVMYSIFHGAGMHLINLVWDIVR